MAQRNFLEEDSGKISHLGTDVIERGMDSFQKKDKVDGPLDMWFQMLPFFF